MREFSVQAAKGMSAAGRRRTLLSTAALSLLLASPAMAQERDSGSVSPANPDASPQVDDHEFGLDEIVVTARKREEALEKVPIAITAITGKAMQERGLGDVSQVADFTPNMQFDFSAPITGSSNTASIFIRGVGQTDFLMSVDPGVGVYVDGVYLSRSMGSVLDMLDVDRVEILRGPQGTLFGKNTIGGAINVSTKRPSDQFEGAIELSTGRFSRFDAKATLNLPIVPGALALRLSGSTQNTDGWARRIDGVDLGDKNADALRAGLLLTIDDDWSAFLSFDWNKAKENSPVSTLLAVNPASQLGGLYNGFVATGPSEIFDGRYLVGRPGVSQVVNLGTDPQGSGYEIYGGSLTIKGVIGSVDLKSVTSYRHMDVNFGNDADHSPLSILSTYNVMEHKQVSQEFNLSGDLFDKKLDWLIGAYYFSEEGWNDTQVPITPGLFQNPALFAFASSLPPGPDQSQLLALYGAGASAAGLNSVDNTSYAAFAHLNIHPSDKLTMTVGLRFTRDEKKAYNGSVFKDLVDTLPPGAPVPDPFYVLTNRNADNAFEDWSPLVNVQYQWTEDVMTYASFSKGFKGGGVSERYRIPRAGPVSFRPEQVRSYEVGFKANLLDRHLRINGAAFYADYDNIQISTVRDVEPLTFNAAKARIQGFELEGTAIVSDALRINASLGYIDAHYVRLDPGVVISINNQFVNTPKWNASLAAEYRLELGSDTELTFRGDYSYRSSVANDAENTPQLMQPGYGLLGAGLTIKKRDLGLSLTVYGRNLTDERYLVTGWSEWNSLGFVEGVWGRPREWGATLRLEF